MVIQIPLFSTHCVVNEMPFLDHFYYYKYFSVFEIVLLRTSNTVSEVKPS